MDGQSTAVPQRRPDHARLTAHYGWVRAVARNLVRDPWGAEDVTQETLLAALAAPPRDVPDDQRLRAWLGRVAFNLSRLGARQGARRRAREVRVARSEALPSVTEELESTGTLAALSRAIAELPEPYKSVVAMRYFDGLSSAEIAARTDSTELAVRKRLWRARNKLRAALDHDPISGRLLAALFAWRGLARRARLSIPGAAAAGLTLLAGATWWCAQGEREHASSVASLAGELPGGFELAASPDSGAAPEPDEARPAGAPRTPARRPAPPPPPSVPERPPFVARVGVTERSARGVVYDLEGLGRAGFELHDPALPAEILATSDALGGFQLALGPGAVRVEARAPGWTTLVPALLEAGVEPAPPIVVALARDLSARVCDESGRSLAGAELALCCDEGTFARIPAPVGLESERLRALRADAQGGFLVRDLARGPGLTLFVSAPGFESLELDTLELGDEELFRLRSVGAGEFLAGRVLYRDGRPAAGAHVRLASASTSADEFGRYRLPLVGVRPESSLGARDPYENAAPAELKGFGARLAGGLEEGDVEVDLVLGEELDLVEGRLVGEEPAGWLVVAYPRAGVRLDAHGDEEPAASGLSAADGSFAFRVPHGTYDLHAVAPDAPRLVSREGLVTRGMPWQVELPAPPVLQGFHAQLGTPDGIPLARAGVEVRLCLEGELGPRRIPWRALTSDDQGGLAFARDPSAEIELALTHAVVGRQTIALASPLEYEELNVPRAAFLQVAAASAGATKASVLDERGRVLVVRGSLRAGESFALQAGRSPVLEVPSEARWLELQATDAGPVRVRIEPRPGEVLQVRR